MLQEVLVLLFAENLGAVFQMKAAFETDQQNKLLEAAELTYERALFFGNNRLWRGRVT